MTSMWHKADLHIHSLYSDGADDIGSILAYASDRTDLDVIAITDHDTLAGAREARRLASRYRIDVVMAQEITAQTGHVLAYFIQELVPAGLSISETVARVREQGGVAILAHPFDRIVSSPTHHERHVPLARWIDMGLDGLEGLNGSQVDRNANPRAQWLGRQLGITLIGGSDAHHKEVIGVAYTRFKGRTLLDLKQTLLDGSATFDGRTWSARSYVHWFTRSFVPRHWRALRGITPVAAVDAN